MSDDRKTYIDSETNLEWLVIPSIKMTQPEAIYFCENLVYDSKSDWRLPTRKELFSLVDDNEYGYNCKIEDIETATYWSYGIIQHNPYYSWYVLLPCGIVDNGRKQDTLNVLAVRGGK